MNTHYEVKKISIDSREMASIENQVLMWSNEKGAAYICTSPNEISILREFQPTGESPRINLSFKPKPSVNSEAIRIEIVDEDVNPTSASNSLASSMMSLNLNHPKIQHLVYGETKSKKLVSLRNKYPEKIETNVRS